MTTLPTLKPLDVIRKLRKAGFIFDRHAPGRDVPKGTLRAIIEQAGLTIDEFVNL